LVLVLAILSKSIVNNPVGGMALRKIEDFGRDHNENQGGGAANLPDVCGQFCIVFCEIVTSITVFVSPLYCGFHCMIFVICVILAGMLLMGFALRNIPEINIAEEIDPKWSAALRSAVITEKPALENDSDLNYTISHKKVQVLFLG